MDGRMWVPVGSGPLARYAAGYGSWLAARGYSRWTVSHRLWQLELLSRWLEGEGLAAGELTVERAERFVLARREAGYSTWVSSRGVVRPLEYLRGLGVAPSPTVLAVGPVEEVLAGYRRYLLEERGVKASTVARYEHEARVFLSPLEGVEGLGLERLTAADVSGVLVHECSLRSVTGARSLVFVVRSLLRYLHVAGVIDAPLEWVVPGASRICGISRCRAGWSLRRSRSSWRAAIVGGRSGAVTTRSCWRWSGSGCAPARSPRSGSRIWTGDEVRSWFTASAAVMTCCHCLAMSARRWSRTCATGR
jgi:hypothetical protein